MTWLITLFIGCYDPTAGTLPDNVGRAFAACQAREIKFLATKHNFQLSFEPCGKNTFSAFSWAPSGARMYFQLGELGYIMQADSPEKKTIQVPTSPPVGMADWINSERLAVPVGPEEGSQTYRIGIYDLEQQSVFYRDAGTQRIDRVLQSGDPTEILFVTREGDTHKLWRMDLADGRTTPAFPWLDGFDTVDWSPVPKRLIVGKDNTVTVFDEAGATIASFSPALRGTLHSEGRWLALEHEGEEISVFYQRAWDDMSDAQRRRERQRAEKLAANLADSYPTTVKPPMISLVDLNDNARFMLTSVHGTEFQWYEAVPYHASFIFWGFEGKQFKRNVLLGQMGSRLRATEIGREFMGVEPMNDIAKNRPPPPTKK